MAKKQLQHKKPVTNLDHSTKSKHVVKSSPASRTGKKTVISLDEFLAAEPDMLDEDDDLIPIAPMDDENDLEVAEIDSSDGEDCINQHKQDLEDLKHSQPEFYKFLLQNDQSLLDFDDETHSVVEEFDHEESEFIQQESKGSNVKTHLDKQLLQQWEADLAKKETANNIRRLVVAFRSAIQDPSDTKSAGYVIDSPSVQSKLIVLAFKHVPTFLTQTLGDSKTSPQSSPKWKSISPMVKVFLTNALKLYKSTNDAGMVEYLLHEQHQLVRYLLIFPKLTKDYFRLLLSTWGTHAVDSLRVLSFAFLRDLVDTYPKKFMEPALKGCYMMFVKSCRRTTVHTLPVLTLMMKCVVDIYGLDPTLAYQTAFIYVRQLAIHLRNAMSAKSKEAYRQVYQWQYIHSLRLWAHMLITYAPVNASHPFTELVYPIVQTMLGVVQLVPTVHYHPLHLHVLSSLTDIVKHCQVYIPLSTHFISIIEAQSSMQALKKSTLKPLYLPVYLRCPKQYTGTWVYVQSIRSNTHVCLVRYLASLGNQIAFPELTVPIRMALKAQLKSTKDSTWAKSVKAVLEKIDLQVKYIQQIRQNADIAPSDLVAIDQLQASIDIPSTPMGVYAGAVERMETKRMEAVQESFVKTYNEHQHHHNPNTAHDDDTDGSDSGSASDASLSTGEPARKKSVGADVSAGVPDTLMEELDGVDVIMDDDSD